MQEFFENKVICLKDDIRNTQWLKKWRANLKRRKYSGF